MADKDAPKPAEKAAPKPPRDYPRWRYHDSKAALVVKSKTDEETETPDGDGWRDSPEAPEKPVAKPAPPPPTPPPVAKPTPPPPVVTPQSTKTTK
jgi:hypothetical protein